MKLPVYLFRVKKLLLRLLCRIGLIRRDEGTRKVIWPIRVDPFHMWHFWVFHAGCKTFPRIGVFRNLPGVVKWIPGRLLPRRWGFRVLGLEVGDRGGGNRLVV